MKIVQICLDSIDKVKDFVQIITPFDNDFDIRSGRHNIDGKSQMGIFSLDLTKPLELDIYGDGPHDDVLEAIKDFLVE